MYVVEASIFFVFNRVCCASVGELYFLATSYPSSVSPYGTIYKFMDPSRYCITFEILTINYKMYRS